MSARYIQVWLHVGTGCHLDNDQDVLDNVNTLLRDRGLGVQIQPAPPPTGWQPPGGLVRAPHFKRSSPPRRRR